MKLRGQCGNPFDIALRGEEAPTTVYPHHARATIALLGLDAVIPLGTAQNESPSMGTPLFELVEIAQDQLS